MTAAEPMTEGNPQEGTSDAVNTSAEPTSDTMQTVAAQPEATDENTAIEEPSPSPMPQTIQEADTQIDLAENATQNADAVPTDMPSEAAGEGEQTAPPQVSVRVLQNSAILYAPDLPAGTYEIHVRFGRRQEASPAVSLQPYLLVEASSDKRTVHMEAQNASPWQRDDQPLTLVLTTTLEGLPGPEQWVPMLWLNGQALDGSTDFTYQVDEAEGALQWKVVLPGSLLKPGETVITPGLHLIGQNSVLLTGDSLTFTVDNRKPAAAVAAPKAVNAFVGVPGREPQEVVVDVTELFEDKDGDSLSYAISDVSTVDAQGLPMADISKDSLSSKNLEISLQGNQLHYLPRTGSGLTTTVTIRATDSYDGESAEASVAISQHNFEQLMQGLRLVPAGGNGISITTDGMIGALGEPNTLNFVLSDDSQANYDMLKDAIAAHELGDFNAELEYTITVQKHSDTQPTSAQGKATVGKDENDTTIGFAIELPVADVETEEVLTFANNVKCFGVELRGLMSNLDQNSCSVSIRNSAPRVADEICDAEYAIELQDFPFQQASYRLSEQLPEEERMVSQWFVDEDSANGRGMPLQYELRVQGNQASSVRVQQDGQDLTPSNSVFTLDGTKAFDIFFEAAGDYTLTFAVFDGDQQATRTLNVQVQSQSQRILLVAIIAVLVCALLIALICFIVWKNKPQFGNLYACLYVTDDMRHCHSNTPAVMMPLASYGRKGVSLLTLALALQQPLLTSANAQCLKHIMLFPARANSLAMLKLHHVPSGTRVQWGNVSTTKASGKIKVSSSPVVISLTDDCALILYLSRTNF